VVGPRYTSIKGIMAAKSKPVETLTLGDLGLSNDGGGQEITSVDDAEARSAGEIVVDDGDGAERIVAFLEQLKIV